MDARAAVAVTTSSDFEVERAIDSEKLRNKSTFGEIEFSILAQLTCPSRFRKLMRDIQPSLKGVVELLLVFFLHYLTRILRKMLEANFLVFVGVRRNEM